MAKRVFKIREQFLTGSKAGSEGKQFTPSQPNGPIPEVVWMRYNLTLNAMNKRFFTTEELFDYIGELEDFIFSAGIPPSQEHIL